MSWYLAVIKKYAVFSGRARRKEYWMFVLFNCLFVIALSFIAALVGAEPESALSTLFGAILGLYLLAVFVPSLAVAVRRFHDIGRSGWWVLISLVPFVGGIIFFIFMLLDSQEGENQYGSNPKTAAS